MSSKTKSLIHQPTTSPPPGKYVSRSIKYPVFERSTVSEFRSFVCFNLYYSFNKALIPRDDKSMEVRSRRYGTRTMFNTAANHQPENYHETTTRASYHNPKTHDKPNYRSRDHSQVFENSAKLLVHKRSDSMASGYETNRQLWDGTGWGTEKNLHSDMYRTAYRNNFNQPKPFHKPELKVTNGRLIRKEQVFDVTDK